MSELNPKGLALVPRQLTRAQVEALASRWGYTIEEAAETYEVILDLSATAPQGDLVERLTNPLDPYTTKAVRDEAATLLQSQAAEIERLKRERDGGRLSANIWKASHDDEMGDHIRTMTRAEYAEADLARAREALKNIRELNMSGADENGHRWANSDLIEQEIVFALRGTP